MLNSSRPIYQTQAWDRAFSVVLLVITFIVAMTGSFFALVSIMGSAVCGPNECDTNIMNVGLFIAGFLPWPVFLAAIAFTITAMIRRRRGVWVSLAGLIFVLTTGAVGIGLIVSQTLNAHH